MGNILPWFYIVAGTYVLLNNFRMLCYSNALSKYLQTNPKGTFLVSKVGLDKAIKLSKTIFLPLGCLLAICFVWLGMRALSI